MEKNKEKKLVKGTFGYVSRKKKRELIITLVMFGIVIGIFVLGLFLNKFERVNVFTIVAVLGMLPASKRLVGFILFAPYKSISKEQYDRVKEIVSDEDKFYADMIITSPQAVMNLAYMVIVGDKIFVLTGREKEKPDMIKEYLQNSVMRRGIDVTVGVFADEKQFEKQVKNASRYVDRDMTKEELDDAFAERGELCEFLESLMA